LCGVSAYSGAREKALIREECESTSKKTEKMAEEKQWLNGIGSKEVTRPQKALDIMKMNHTECGDGWKRTSSTPWRFEVKREFFSSFA